MLRDSMSMTLENYVKKHDYLICVDSDGCAMDTMNIKHFRCFGPCMVEEWGLEKWNDAILNRWNEINLFTMTRGINRFKGLAMALREINNQYTSIEDIETLEHFVETSKELSNGAITRYLEENTSVALEKALSWSKKVNASIDELSFEEKKPYVGVLEGLSFAHELADIAIVSSANYEAVIDEWDYYKLLDHVDIVMAQNVGSKAFCIAELLKKGYDVDKVLMTGDAPGDLDAATKNGVFYFPILVNKEKESWVEFKETAVNNLIQNMYAGEYQEKKIAEFKDNLK